MVEVVPEPPNSKQQRVNIISGEFHGKILDDRKRLYRWCSWYSENSDVNGPGKINLREMNTHYRGAPMQTRFNIIAHSGNQMLHALETHRFLFLMQQNTRIDQDMFGNFLMD